MTIHMKNLERLSLAEMEEFVQGNRKMVLSLEGQDHLPVALDELLHLGQTQPLQILHVNSHSPAGCPFSPGSCSGSPRIGNDFPFQAHAALETTSLSRLISHWTILVVDRDG